MADKIISDLESVVSVTGDMLLPLENSIGTFAGSVDDLKNYIVTNFPNASETVKGFLELLTNAELAAGVDTSRAATAAAIASLFGTSLRSNDGYVRLPIKVGGAFVEIIIQWGQQSVSSAATSTVTLPLTFPTATLAPYQSIIYDGTISNLGANNTAARFLNTSQLQLANYHSSALLLQWLAIGY